MSAARPNSLQAVLEREAREVAAVPAPEPPAQPSSPAPSAPLATTAAVPRLPKAAKQKTKRPSRDGRRFLGGHFEPGVVKAMRMLAAEEDTTVQALLEEAVDLLFLKKGKGRIVRA
ncbi:conserved protein of unknown function (plasmid) [Rhodovastum atsumiense]|uniref:Antitoxin-like ribbon-helix-helix domain-containing protein n=1 Tax=Rhodovastum atsumiense TaxID=504468 RepID=A0A5M6IU49_9PROT|nr:ribbon-helix-helix domain-containing protein [Rhodovastum atsumiense]KAA5611792.1 hypothetical protein F1189_12185 [Rhodovastum atsumiense]CAH2606101.1 conserved protein of unknown function [Rhodovastum atsumiense]